MPRPSKKPPAIIAPEALEVQARPRASEKPHEVIDPEALEVQPQAWSVENPPDAQTPEALEVHLAGLVTELRQLQSQVRILERENTELKQKAFRKQCTQLVEEQPAVQRNSYNRLEADSKALSAETQGWWNRKSSGPHPSTTTSFQTSSCDRPEIDVETSKVGLASPASGGTLGRWRPDKETSCAQKFLDIVPSLMIIANAVTLGLSCQYDQEGNVWKFLELGFAAAYLAEFLLKLCLCGFVFYFSGADMYWNWFDFICLLCSLFDQLLTFAPTLFGNPLEHVGIVKAFRVLRLLRTARTLKLRIFSQLMQMIMGILHGISVLCWSIILLFGLIYVLAIFMVNVNSSDIEEFRNLSAAMFTLFRCFTDGCSAYDGTPLSELLRREFGMAFSVGYVLIMMLVTVGIFNMVMAFFLDNAVVSAIRRKQKELGESSPVIEEEIKRVVVKLIDPSNQWCITRPKKTSLVKKVIRSTMMAINSSGSSSALRSHARFSPWILKFDNMKRHGITIDRETFLAWTEVPEFLDVLERAEVDVSNRSELFDILDADMGGLLELDELVTGLMKLRGPPSRNELVAIRLKVGLLTQLLRISQKSES